MKDMFNKCHNLISLNLNNFNTSKVQDMGWMFYDCYSLIDLNINKFDTTSVTNMEGMFTGCNNLTILNLNNFYTPNVINMKDMFKNCTSLKVINLKNSNTNKVTDMRDMFNNCHSLIYLNLKSFDTSTVTQMNAMFYDCKSLLYLNMNIFTTSNIYNSSYCTGLFEKYNTSLKFCFNNIENNDNNCTIPYTNNSECNEKYLKDDNKFIIQNNKFINNCSNYQTFINEYTNQNNENLGNYSNNQSYIVYEYNNMCYENCPYGTHLNNSDFCEDDLICSDYYNYTECIEEIPEGYYCNDTINKTINKCDSKCNTCSLESVENNNLCLSCNVNENYFPKYNDSLNNNGFLNCYNESQENYFIENETYMPCYETCKECNKSGNILNHGCTECNSSFTLNDSNCYPICKSYYYFDSDNIYHCTEEEECPSSTNKLIIEKNKCIDNCNNDDKYKKEYKKKCYESCPNETYSINSTNQCIDNLLDQYYILDFENKIIDKCDNKCKNCSKDSIQYNLCIFCNNEQGYYPKFNDDLNNNNFINCYNDSLEGYFLDKNTLEYKPCYFTCKKCNESGNEIEHKCTECKNNRILQNGLCIEEIDDECLYINVENKKCLKECSALDFFSNICMINYNNSSNNSNNIIEAIDNMIKKIDEAIRNHSMDELLYNLTKGYKNDLLLKFYDMTFQITTSDNQNNNQYDNISTIILGKCEVILKDKHEIDPNETLIIFKVEYYKPNTLIPIIGYEIYNPESKQKLNLNYCKEELIDLNISIPVSIDEDKLFKYNPDDEYYINECIPYTTENGTDILINDRQDEFNNNNLSICENDCSFIKYESETKKSICKCAIKNKQLTVSELVNNTDILSNNFTKKGESSMVSMKCYYTLFTKDGILKNIGSYILLFTILEFVISGLLFYKIGYHLLEDIIKNILEEKKEEKNKNISNTILETNAKDINNINNKGKKKKGKKKIKNLGNPIKKGKKVKKLKNTKKGKKLKKGKKGKIIFQKRKKRKKFFNSKIMNIKDLDSSNNQKSFVQLKIKNDNIIHDNKLIINKKSLSNNIQPKNFNNFELNSLPYNEALIYDKRSFGGYYISLICSKQLIIF